MKSVVVEVRKGMVTDIYSDDKDVQFVVVDWDLPDYGEPNVNRGFLVDPSQLELMPVETRSVLQQTVS